MRVKFFCTVFNVAILGLSFGARAAEEKPDQTKSCEPRLRATTGPLHTSRLNVGQPLEFAVRGDGWMRMFVTPDRRVLMGVINDREQLEVFEVESRTKPEMAMPTPFPSKPTRGEWSAFEGQPHVHLGEVGGRLHHLRVGPESKYEPQLVAEGQAVFPLATTSTGGVLVGLPYLGRVRIMPAPGRGDEGEFLDITTGSFRRAAHFPAFTRTPGLVRDLVATVSNKTLDVIDLGRDPAEPHWSYPLTTNGENTTVTFFQPPGEEPALVANDGTRTTIHFPFEPERVKLDRALDGHALGRVRALVAPSGRTFIEAPGTLGSKIFTYERGTMKFFAMVPPAVARHQKEIFVAPNGRVFLLWIDHAPGQPPRVKITKVSRGDMTDYAYQYTLEDHEVVHDSQHLVVTPELHYVALRTNFRVLCIPLSPLPAD